MFQNSSSSVMVSALAVVACVLLGSAFLWISNNFTEGTTNGGDPTTQALLRNATSLLVEKLNQSKKVLTPDEVVTIASETLPGWNVIKKPSMYDTEARKQPSAKTVYVLYNPSGQFRGVDLVANRQPLFGDQPSITWLS